jgi:HAD superfamily hydrolase (TIGR01490 family)
MAKKFAVFDIDGTVVRTSLFLQTLDQLILDGQLPADTRAQLDEKLAAYRDRQHADAFLAYTDVAVTILFDNIQSVPVSAYRAAVDTVLAHTKGHSYVYTRDLIKSLKQDGYFLVALSGSEMYAVQQFAAHYDFDVAVGEEYRETNGMFTGEVDGVVHAKDAVLRQLITKHDLSLKDSLAIGDSNSDAKMLELVERPIAFNPERRLYEAAKEHGWKIVIERKNVIYELEPGDGSYLLA